MKVRLQNGQVLGKHRSDELLNSDACIFSLKNFLAKCFFEIQFLLLFFSFKSSRCLLRTQKIAFFIVL